MTINKKITKKELQGIINAALEQIRTMDGEDETTIQKVIDRYEDEKEFFQSSFAK